MATLTASDLGPLRLSPKHVVRVMKRVHLVYPQGWITQHLPLHFQNRATRRYGYTPRAGQPGSGRRFRGSHTERKLRRYHHTRPLEFTGRGKADALAGRRASSTRNSATAVVPGRVWNRRPAGSRIRMYEEIVAITPTEEAELEVLGQRKSDAEFRRLSR